jgi:glutaredoxin
MKNVILILAMSLVFPFVVYDFAPVMAESIKAISPIAQTDSRIFDMGGYTAFMVNGNYLFTTKHCDEGRNITMNDGTKGVKVYTTRQSDGPIVYKLEGGPYKSFAIASSVPTERSSVWTAGYVEDNYQVQNAKIFGFNHQDGLNHLNIRVTPGQSGSPVLNDNDEVVGIVQSVMKEIYDIRSLVCSHGELIKALQGIGEHVASPDVRPDMKYELVIFGFKGCQWCEKMEHELDVKVYARKGINVRKIDIYNDPQAAEYIAAFRKQTGFTGSMSYPTTWVNGTKEYKVGYQRPNSLLGWIGGIIQGIVKGIVNFFGLIIGGPSDPEPYIHPPNLTPEGGSSPAPEGVVEEDKKIAEVDWENVTIIVVASKFLDGKKGIVGNLGLRAIEGLLHRANDEFLDGKASMYLADERTHPARYKAITDAAKVVPDPVTVLVLVEKQSIGLKGLIAAKIERTIQDKFDGIAKAEIIFERVHKQSYKALKAAIMATVTVPYQRESIKDLFVDKAKDVVKDKVILIAKEKFPDHTEKLEAISSTLAEIRAKEAETGEKKSLPAKVIAIVAALFGAGYVGGGAKGLLANIAIKRAMKKLKEEDEIKVVVDIPKVDLETVKKEAKVVSEVVAAEVVATVVAAPVIPVAPEVQA